MNGRNPPPEWPVDDDHASNEPSSRHSRTDVVRARGGALSWTTMALIAGLIILVALVAYFATTRNPDQDKLTGEVATGDSTATDPSKLCASNSTYNLIKRDIFRRAAQVRGSDQATYDKLSNYAVLRMENPVMESQDAANNAVNCSGSLAIDLPPGLGVVGGRRTLNADVDYTVQPAADGSGNAVILRNANSIITPLATLARLNEAASAAPAPPDELNQAAPPEPGGSTPSDTRAPSDEPQPPMSSGARPSFDCAKARTKGEIAVCSDAGLAALDRNMAAQYGRAMEGASPDQAALLRRTRDRFLSYRDHCPSRSCMGDAYVGRMREIRDIVEGRWQPPR